MSRSVPADSTPSGRVSKRPRGHLSRGGNSLPRPIGIRGVLGLTGTGGTAAAQEVDARAALEASIKAMGDVRTVEYAGAGFTSLIGQQYSVDVGWPSIEVANYTRAI